MAVKSGRTKIERARQYISTGGITREDSDDELGLEDHPWEWIYAADEEKDAENGTKKARSRKVSKSDTTKPAKEPLIVGARMGNFECRIGDTVLLKADGKQAWVALICAFSYDAENDEKMANFMWFSTRQEIKNKAKRLEDYLENEIYITPSWDDNPLASINGKAVILSPEVFAARYPNGKIARSSKDYGKVFICRHGCNTRTATYTEEFIWEDVYRGPESILDLITLVQGQTKATRKKSGQQKRKLEDGDDFVPAADEESGVPKTPRKKRKLDGASTPTSKRKDVTPRKFLTPTHRRIIVKRPLEFTPLGTRILSPSALSSPFQIARNQLHVSSVPATLPCREEEFANVYSHLEAAITDGTGACIYISGTPGTGKTATVREVIAQLNAAVLAEELDDFVFVEINGMKVTDPHQAYSLLWEALRGDRVSPAQAQQLLEREFSTPSPRRVPCVVLMDELDQLVTKNQSVMYNFFNWPSLRHSRLIVLAVANTMDLPERTLSNKISSRLGLTRITFPGYTHEQLMQIISSRLSNVPGNIVHPDAVQFASRKVAAVSGDARRALDICRRAVEIAEQEAMLKDKPGAVVDEDVAPDTPSKTKRAKQQTLAQPPARTGIVTIATVKTAINEATSSPLAQHLRRLPLSAKLFLGALLARLRRTGIGEAALGDVMDEAKSMAEMDLGRQLGALLEAPNLNGAAQAEAESGRRGVPKRIEKKPARIFGIRGAVDMLAESGVIGVESRRGDRVGRVRLAVGNEEVRIALREDEESRALGFES